MDVGMPSTSIPERAPEHDSSLRVWFVRGVRRLEDAAVPSAAVLTSIALFGLFVALAGHDPVSVFAEMYRGAFGTWFSFQNTLLRAAPLMLTGLCTALPARLGLIVI